MTALLKKNPLLKLEGLGQSIWLAIPTPWDMLLTMPNG